MGRQPTVSAARPDRDARLVGMLEEFYGAAVPATAWLLVTYVRDRAIPLSTSSRLERDAAPRPRRHL